MSQRNEIGVTGGVSYYFGDLNPSGHFKYYDPAGGIFFRTNIGRRISFRYNFLYAQVQASDADGVTDNQINRNLSFYSDIYEAGVWMEINFRKYQIGKPHRDAFRSTPYLFFGLSYFNMNPKTDYNGSEVELQPLGTEGQGTSANDRRNYSLNQICMPVGLGFKFNVGNVMAVAIEYGLRKTFTDYLDDVSGTYASPAILAAESNALTVALADRSFQQELPDGTNTGTNRGNEFTKDWYAYAGLNVSFKLGKADSCENFGSKTFE